MNRMVIFSSIMLVSMCGCDSPTTDRPKGPIESTQKNLIELFVVKSGKRINLQDFLNKSLDDMVDKPDDDTVTKALKKSQREKYHLEQMNGDICLEFIYNDSYLSGIISDENSFSKVNLYIPGLISYSYNKQPLIIDINNSSREKVGIYTIIDQKRTSLTFNKMFPSDVKSIFKNGNRIKISGFFYDNTRSDLRGTMDSIRDTNVEVVEDKK